MLRLALETSGLRGSVALFDANQLLECIELPSGLRTAQSLAPTIQSLMASQGRAPNEVQGIAVTEGPGSFTGLRVGVTTAKTLAYVIGAELVPVNTLDVIARQAQPWAGHLWCVLDAQRQQLFAAQYEMRDGVSCCTRSTQIVDNEAWLAELGEGNLVSGPGLKPLRSQLPAHAQCVDETRWFPTATAVGQVAWNSSTAPAAVDPMCLVPQYYRLSAAEEKAK